MLSQQVINAQVLRGLDKNRHRTLDLVSRLPSGLQGIGREYSRHERGTAFYRAIERGKYLYRMYCFTKDADGGSRWEGDVQRRRRAGCGTRGGVLASQKAGIPLTSNIDVVIPSLFGSSQTFRSHSGRTSSTAFRSLLARRDEATHQR